MAEGLKLLGSTGHRPGLCLGPIAPLLRRACVGCIRSAPNIDDWMECDTCGAFGEVASEVGSACEGAGWRFVGESIMDQTS
jgi:hypothetical protein